MFSLDFFLGGESYFFRNYFLKRVWVGRCDFEFVGIERGEGGIYLCEIGEEGINEKEGERS